MMETLKSMIQILLIVLVASACSKSDFLDEKPRTDIVVANTLADFNNLLENTTVTKFTGGLAQMASDDYIIPNFAEWQGISSNTQRNSYIWKQDIYEGDNNVQDWNAPYKSIFYSNAVLDGLESSSDRNTQQGQYLKGRALFVRSYALYDLVRNFCKAYNKVTAQSELGIPLRISSAIEQIEQRATLQQTYDRILTDLSVSEQLLPSERPSANLNRPSKIAVYALLARIYLDMGLYPDAELNADRCLGLYSTLIDYNLVSKTSATPFSNTNDELIYNTVQISFYSELTGTGPSSVARINQELIDSYHTDDLRIPLYFTYSTPSNAYIKKRGYHGTGLYPFTGLATDEVYLIKAECLARRNEPQLAMDRLNMLLIKRFPNTIAKPYIPVAANSSSDALAKILLERRKELVWRGLRWHDIKRLNREGAKISLTRNLNGSVYTLDPDDARWVFPIPEDEISLSGIEQNKRY